MKKILITGGAGFLGSHLCEKLVLNNDVVDRAPLANLEQAKMFFMKRKDMTEEQFNELGYSVRLVEPRRK